MIVGRGRISSVAVLAIVATVLTAVVPALGQNNSLFGRRPRANSPSNPPPTSQPAAAGQPANGAAPAGGVVLGARSVVQQSRIESKPNATLLTMSPIAVASPRAEKVAVQDQVTIIIRESKTATTDSKLESKKDWTLDAELSKWLRFSDKHGVVPAKLEGGNPAIAFDYANDYKGDGKYDRKDELTTRIQAKVIDVKPNGTLVLEANKSITIDEEGYNITLIGSCRSADLTPQNTILSTQIADMVIDVKHKGAVRDATQRGWLMRGLDFAKPF